MEKFMYPCKNMRITQGYDEGSHKSSYAIDDGEIDTGRSTAYAPYSGTVKVIYPQYENQVFFESDEPVLFADGTVDYAVTLVEHQNSPMAYGMAVGKHYNQGEPFYVEGGRYAGVNNRVASHIHMEFARGKYQRWYKNASGTYSLRDAKRPQDCCFIDDSYQIFNDNGYGFKNASSVAYETGNYQCLYNMNVRTGAGTDFAKKKVSELTEDGKAHATSQNMNDNAIYKKDTVFTAKEIIYNEDSVWARSPSGYICIADTELVYCQRV